MKKAEQEQVEAAVETAKEALDRLLPPKKRRRPMVTDVKLSAGVCLLIALVGALLLAGWFAVAGALP